MKTLCGFIGWIIGMFLGFAMANTAPFLAFVFIIGGIFVGRYIGGCIEENKEKERKAREEAERRRRQEEYARQQKAQRRLEAKRLARRFPEATKSYFKQHWGIVKSSISDYDITEDKVDTLLGHKWSYESDEIRLNLAFRAQKEAERQEQIRKEAERREAERREQLRKEAETREAERQAMLAKQRAEEQAKQKLRSGANGWYLLGGCLRYNYLLRYYPTTCDIDATESEWADRWTVWNFKNTPGKTSSSDHQRALDTVIPQIKSKLISTFGSDALKCLTLVCIPASSADKTQARYKDFSNRLCRETGMNNAYDKMQVVSSSSEKKFGGSGISANNVSFDASYFRGKYVLLFDDVITKGDSMLRFKKRMEELGATVIGGFSIGKTTHSRY